MHGRRAWWLASGIAAAGLALGADQGAVPSRQVDAPLLRISCDELPVRTPTPVEAREDEAARPYHALVRVFTFPGRAPYDVPVERIRLLGAGGAARVGPGEYYVTSIEVGYTSVAVLDDAAAARSPGPGRRPLAIRNPLVLARHAITVCDLFVPEEARLDEATTFRGVVVDRATLEPLHGAAIRCGDRLLATGADGRFEFAEPIPWRDLLTRTMVSKDGFRMFVMNPATLNAPWVDRILGDGESVFALVREDAEKAGGPLPQLGR